VLQLPRPEVVAGDPQVANVPAAGAAGRGAGGALQAAEGGRAAGLRVPQVDMFGHANPRQRAHEHEVEVAREALGGEAQPGGEAVGDVVARGLVHDGDLHVAERRGGVDGVVESRGAAPGCCPLAEGKGREVGPDVAPGEREHAGANCSGERAGRRRRMLWRRRWSGRPLMRFSPRPVPMASS
jgi:hypothetical protein